MATVALSGIITPSNVVTATSTTTLTNKTLTAPTIASANLTTALTIAGAAGSSGNVLTSGGSGNAPTWSTPAGGAWVYIGSVSASSSASVDLTGISATYSNYAVIGDQISTINIALRMRIFISSTILTASSYSYHLTNTSESSTAYAAVADLNNDYVTILSADLENNGSFMLYLSGANAAIKKTMHWTGSLSSSSNNVRMCHGSAGVNNTGTITGLRFLPASSTIATGNFHLYGIKNS